MSSALRRPAQCAGTTLTLHPGDVEYAERGERLETLLGSCVAIVLTDARRTFGVMCHVVHATLHEAPDEVQTSAYGSVALDAMYGLLLARGITPSLCEAYVFGGGNMFPNLFRANHVGANNTRWALGALADDGIRVIAEHIGGTVYRRVGWTVGPDAPQVVAVEV